MNIEPAQVVGAPLTSRSAPVSAFVAPPDLNGYLADDFVSGVLTQAADGRASVSQLRLEARSRDIAIGEVYKLKGLAYLRLEKELSNSAWLLQGDAGTVSQGDVVLARFQRGPGAKLEYVRHVTSLEERSWLGLLSRHALSDEVDARVEEEAQILAQRPHQLGGRRDLRSVPTITVDAPSTRDIDDAISVLPGDREGSLRIVVSIADVAAFVEESSRVDLHARDRGTSVYLAGRVLPMLPESLSADHLSLLPGVDRACISVELRIDPEGGVRAIDVYESLIRSKARVSYQELAEYLEHQKVAAVLEPVKEILPWLRTADARLALARTCRGGLEVTREEIRILFDTGSGEPAGVEQVTPTRAHALIERFMVAANEAVAGWLHARGVPTLFRSHAPPTPDAVSGLEAAGLHFGVAAAFGPTLTPLALAAFDRQLTGFPYEAAIRSVLLRSLGPALYSPEAKGHFGLGAPLYLHFTSPIRRYADLTVHRLIKAYLAGERQFQTQQEEFIALAAHINRRNLFGSRAENEQRRILMGRLMKPRVGEKFSARVTRVRDIGLIVQLDETWVEGLLPVESLPDGPYALMGGDSALVGLDRRFEPGMALHVRLKDVNLERGRLTFSWVG